MKQNNRPFNETGDKTVFKVPENYFENFQAELEKRLDNLNTEEIPLREKVQSETEVRKPILRIDTFRPIMYMAAIFILMLFSISVVLNYTSDKTASSLRLSAESTSNSNVSAVPTAEDYLINSVGTYGITEYYVESESLE